MRGFRYFQRRSKNGGFAVVASLAIAVLPLAAVAQTPSPPPSLDAAIAAIAASAPAAMAYQGTPGLAIAITDRTHTVRILTFGYANVDAKTPVSDTTRFAIGSITKSMTALALLQLHDAGKVDLDAPVARYVPWFRINSGGKPIRIHQLLSHTAGIPDNFSQENSWLYDVAALRGTKTLFAPGTDWSYSNDGFATLGAVIAAVERRSWANALQARVFGPLAMTHASPIMTPQTLSTAAVGYQLLENDRPPSSHPALTASPPYDFINPAGSVVAMPEDMARYMRFYLRDGKRDDGTPLLSAASFKAMTHADHFLNGRPAGAKSAALAESPTFYRRYGFGLSTFDERGDHLVGHTGGISGYTSCMQINLTRGFGVIALANHEEAPLHPCAIVLYAMRALRAQSEGKTLPPRWQAPDIAHVPHAAAYAGAYASPRGSTLQVLATAGHLALVDGTHTIKLYPRGGDLFWADDPKYALFLLNFSRDKHKAVVAVNYGPTWFANDRYRGPRTFHYPASWNALVGRYENVFTGSGPSVTRVVIVNNALTFDGTTPLTPRPDGTFALGPSIVRFDVAAGKEPLRLDIDDTHLYRVDLP
jgi:D-alanyl-D-alanine carboxypeptidase